MNVLERFSAVGVQFRLDGEKVIARGQITPDLKSQMREAKEEILAEMQAIEARRRRLLALLAERPDNKCAVIYDSEASKSYDILIVAIAEAAFEVRVPKPADSLDLAQRLVTTLDRYACQRSGRTTTEDSTGSL